MVNRFPDKFLRCSRDILEENSEIKAELNAVMGCVADSIVRDKYVEAESADEDEHDKSEEADA